MRPVHFCLAAIAAASLLAVTSCGGGGSDSVPISTGLYQTAYNRADGTIIINVNAQFSTDIVVNDSTEGRFTGSSVVTHNGTFSAVCTRSVPTFKQVVVSGLFAGSNNSPQINGAISGAISVGSFAAPRRGAEGTVLFAGSFHGSTTGSVMVDLDGAVTNTGSATFVSSSFFGPLSGTVTPQGAVSLSGNGTTFTGTMVLRSDGTVSGSGTWVGIEDAGQWTLNKIVAN